MFFKGQNASQWFVYGTLYTLVILALGVKFMYKYRHNRYQLVRTVSVMFFQLGFAFLIPEILAGLNSALPYNDFKNMWPLNYYFFYDYNLKALTSTGALGLFMLIFGVLMIFIISPVLTYFYGKRWYCSWVCGCGGLAETAGDSFRHLSDKSLNAWKLERWLIHLVLVFVVLMTIGVLYSFFHKNPEGYWINKELLLAGLITIFILLAAILVFRPGMFRGLQKPVKYAALGAAGLLVAFMVFALFADVQQIFFIRSGELRSTYGFLIGAMFSGVIGVGFYPILGNRVWCRFGCPMAAILGLQQRFLSRFRITTNGGQCISCGNCSTYCEQGIDVRWYAQRGQNIVRSSCVGCGICSAVCPRGVLKLENGPLKGRINK
jgi:polyferredoxin